MSEEWKLDTKCDLYETMSTNYNNTRNKVDWITEGTGKMDSTVSVMPFYMDQQGVARTRSQGPAAVFVNLWKD